MNWRITWNASPLVTLIALVPTFAPGSLPARVNREVAPSQQADEINFVNPLLDYDWLNEGRPVRIRNDGLPSFGPNSFTAQSYYEDNKYSVQMQRVPATVSDAPWLHHSLRLTTLIPGAPRPLDQGLLIYQAFEGLTVGRLHWGSTLARPISVGFWARASVAGEYAFAIQNLYPDPPKPPRHVPDRSFVANFRLDAGHWKFVRIENIPGDTEGKWIASSHRPALQMGFTLEYPTAPATPGIVVGSDRKWVHGNALAGAGQVNLPEYPGATFEFTGIQWNIGPKLSNIRPIRHEHRELALMRRNFQKSYPEGVMIGTPAQPGGVSWRATKSGRYAAQIPVTFKAPLRTSAPRLVPYGQYSGRQHKISINGLDSEPAAIVPKGSTGVVVTTAVRDWKVGDMVQFQWTAEGPWM